MLAPLLLHLKRQPPTKVTEFSSLLFLEPTPLATSTRRRLERWLLLLLRCLVLLLLALMFARPYRAEDTSKSGGGAGTATVLLLDQSASMGRKGLWEEAVERALQHVADSRPEDRLALGLFSHDVVRKIDFPELDSLGAAERASRIRQVLSNVKPRPLATRLDTALSAAVGWLDDTRAVTNANHPPSAHRQVVLVSDLQEGATVSGLAGLSWPQDVTLSLETVTPESTGNLSLALANTEDSGDPAATETLRIRLSSAPEGDASTYRLILDGDEKNPKSTGQILPGTTRILRVPRPADRQPHLLSLTGVEDWTADNQLHIAPIQPQQPEVLVVAARPKPNSADSPVFYLQRALQPTPQIVPKLTIADASQVNGWNSATWGIIVLDDTLEAHMRAAKAFVEKGRHLLVLAAASAPPKSLEPLLGAGVGLSEAKVGDYALLTDLDTKHPTLQVFADPRLSNFSQLHIWHHRQVTGLPAGAKTLATYDDRSPALVDIPVGKGRVHLLTTTWAPRDSQLALVPQFIPLLYSVLQQTGASLESSYQLVTGQTLPGPEGKVAEALGSLDINGQKIAVNLPPDESRLTPLTAGVFAGFNIPVSAAGGHETLVTADNATRLTHEALEGKQQYWLILLAALLWIVGLETWLASKKPSAASETAAA